MLLARHRESGLFLRWKRWLLTWMLEENSNLPAEMMAGTKAGSILLRCTQGHHVSTAGAPQCFLPRPTSLVGQFLGYSADLEKQSVQWPHWCLESLSLPPFLYTQKTRASLCPQWLQCEPLPTTMAPFNVPPRATAPSLTACVRRAVDTKGGVSRFSAHFTSIHRRRNKSSRPCTLGRAEAGLGHPHQQNRPQRNATFFWWGVKSTLCFRIIVQSGSWLFLPSTQDICIKMGFFCPLRRTKRKLGRGAAHEGKGSKELPNKD